MVLCPLGDLLAEGSAESAQAEAAAVLSARQHSTLLQLRPRGVWAGGATACISTSQNPKLTPEGIWKETWRKTTPSAGLEKADSPIRKREFENGQFSPISAVRRRVGDSRVGDSRVATVRGEGWLQRHPSQFLPSPDSVTAHHLAVLLHSTILPP